MHDRRRLPPELREQRPPLGDLVVGHLEHLPLHLARGRAFLSSAVACPPVAVAQGQSTTSTARYGFVFTPRPRHPRLATPTVLRLVSTPRPRHRRLITRARGAMAWGQHERGTCRTSAKERHAAPCVGLGIRAVAQKTGTTHTAAGLGKPDVVHALLSKPP